MTVFQFLVVISLPKSCSKSFIPFTVFPLERPKTLKTVLFFIAIILKDLSLDKIW